ncbi:MAG: PorP/SprF family type IX secretion system membrane protein [Solitalea-like symbiont of Acarus siro]
MFRIKKASSLIIYCIVILFANVKVNAQQDILTTQHIFNKYYINPAHAGENISLQGSGFFRSPWTGVKNAPTTYLISIDSSIPGSPKAGIGVIGGVQSAGPFNTILGYADFAYSITLTENSNLKLGTGLGISNYSYNGNKVDPGPIHDPAAPNTKISMMIPDVRIGIVYEAKDKLSFGLSADNIISPFMNYGKDPKIILPKKHTNIYTYGTYIFSPWSNVKLAPTIMVSKRLDNTPVWLEGILKGSFNNLVSAGIAYRTYLQTGESQYSSTNSVSALAEVLAIKNIVIGYTFDFGIGDTNLNKGTHELFIQYKFNWPNKIVSETIDNENSSSTTSKNDDSKE